MFRFQKIVLTLVLKAAGSMQRFPILCKITAINPHVRIKSYKLHQVLLSGNESDVRFQRIVNASRSRQFAADSSENSQFSNFFFTYLDHANVSIQFLIIKPSLNITITFFSFCIGFLKYKMN